MSIGVNTNQPSDLSSLNSGSDINTSNQPSDDDADAFAAMVGQNSSDSAEVIVPRDFSGPTLLTPDFEQSEVGLGSPFDHVGNFSGRINRGVGPILVDAGFKFKPPPEGLIAHMTELLQHSSAFQKLDPQAQKDIANMLTNVATGDVGPNNLIKGTLNAVIDSISELSSDEKSTIKKVVDVLCDVVATAAFIAALPESMAGILENGGAEIGADIDKLAHMAKGWWTDMKNLL